jgi:hypothetical protein
MGLKLKISGTVIVFANSMGEGGGGTVKKVLFVLC